MSLRLYDLHITLIEYSYAFATCAQPLLLHCTQIALGKEIQFSKKWLHYLPFLMYSLYTIFFYIQPVEFKYNAFIGGFRPELPFIHVQRTISNDPLGIQGFMVVEGIVIHLVIYTILGLRYIYKSKHISEKIDARLLPWLKLLNGMALLAAVVLFLSEGGIINGEVFFKAPLPFHTASLMPSVYVYALSIFLMKDSNFFKISGVKYQKSVLSGALQAKYLSKIQEALEFEKLHLNCEFSLSDLAQSTGLKPHHISQVINSQLNTNFYDLVNSYRISEAKKILASADSIKIESLAYQVGYKSKSAFFIAFKKLTNTTPAQYRKEIHKSFSRLGRTENLL
ncbi:MAG: helix-turn-helix transcriptional regulator [Saprospiraceae bacterium]|nr:helix-turn-helix transcriptional regulator [Saprospiraceae bacterium]